MFKGNDKVSFADINLQEVKINGDPHNPGKGGWPTIRYFNKETGQDGKSYDKKTSKNVCDELGDDDYMIAYVEEAGSTALCNLDGAGCNEKEKKYIEKMKKLTTEHYEDELDELESIDRPNLHPDTKDWITTRKRILKKLFKEKGISMDEL